MSSVLTTLALPSFSAFAQAHCYKMQVNYVTEDDTDRTSETARTVRWQKLRFIRSALEQSDVVVWFDADVLVCRTDVDILDCLGDSDYQGLTLHRVVKEHRTNPNTGVWVLRNTSKTFRLLDRLTEIGMPDGRWADQGALMRAFGWHLGDDNYQGAQMPDVPTEFMRGTAWLPLAWNQPFHERYTNPDMSREPFALHFMGMTVGERMQSMQLAAQNIRVKSGPQLRKLKVGFRVSTSLPKVLQPLGAAVVESYRRHHIDLRAVFAIGSVPVQDWREGVSDFDVVGVVHNEFTAQDEIGRRTELLEMGQAWPQISFINNSALSLAALKRERPDPMVLGRARIIAVTGLQLWGDPLDFSEYEPSVETMAYGRTTRARILMNRYRAGILNEPFLSNSRLLNRSCAKAALRVLSGITILRGAIFFASSEQTVLMIEQFAPEALPLAQTALAIVNGKETETIEAIRLADEAVELFYSLYPESVY